jgi:adenosylhomocysteine nucleosidase
MWLRWVVSNLLNQMAEDKLRQTTERAKHLVKSKKSVAAGQSPKEERVSTPPEVVAMFALGIESGGLVDRMTDVVTTEGQSFVERDGMLNGRRLVVAESGVGCRAARQATEDVIKIHQPQWIISAGFAGALVSDLPRGHILMADSIVDQRHQPLDVGFKIPPEVVQATPSLHVGRLLTVDHLIRQSTEKQQLATDCRASACDMETMAVAQACRRRHVRFLSVRIISDGLDDKLPPEVEHMLDQQSFAGKLGAATRAVFRRPGSLKDMWNLRETAIRASDRLAQFLVGVVPQLVEQGRGEG